MGQVLVGKLKNIKRPEGLEGGRKGKEGAKEREGKGDASIWVFSRGLGKHMFPGKKTKIS